MAKLGEVFNLQITGEWGNDCSENKTGTKVLRTTNFTPEGKLSYDNVVNRTISDKKILEKKLQYGDIILEKSGGTEKNPVGRVVFCDEQINNDIFLCNNFTQAMRTNSNIACPKYIFYFMWFLHFSGKTDLLQNKTTGIRNLQLKSYLNIEIPLPPLEEQQKIAAVLDKVTDLIDKRKQQLTKLDELIKSRFVEMFGDISNNQNKFLILSLQSLINQNFITYHLDGNHGGDYPRNEEFTQTGIPYIGANCIDNGNINFSNSKYLPEEKANKLKKGIAQSGDVLFAHNATVGPVALLTTSEKKIILSTSLTAYRCNLNFLNPYYLRSYMESSNFIQQYILEMKQTTRNQIPITAQRKYLFLVPPIDLQNQFAEFVEQTEKTKVAINHSLDKLKTLKKALMQKYFG